MGRKLDILIPHYHETADVIKPLLNSIALQQAIDFNDVGVIIVHDGEDIPDFFYPSTDFDYFDDSALDYCYPFEIRQLHIPHGGVSAARNAALDASDAEYVMFCDCDDIFYNACGLWIIFREMSFGEFDSMTSFFIEEYRKKSGETVFVSREKDSTFVHGKIHRRAYLVENDIRWNEALTIHEDGYFNVLAQSLSENVKYCNVPFYLWKWREDSVCRHDPKYMLRTYRNFIDSNDALVKEFTRRGKAHEAEFYTVMMIFQAYYTMNKPEWINQENKVYRDSTEKRFAEYYREHKAVWDGAKPENKMKVSNNVRTATIKEGMNMESLTIDDWLRHVETL